MRRLRLVYGALVYLAMLGFAAPTKAIQLSQPDSLQLLSLVNLPIKSGLYLSQFEIDTWAVQIIAICAIPAGWDIGGGTDGSPNGTLHGNALIGLAFLATPSPHQLRDVFLVKLDQLRLAPVISPDGATHPASFTGKIDIGHYGSDERTSTPLLPDNFALRPASQCPPP